MGRIGLPVLVVLAVLLCLSASPASAAPLVTLEEPDDVRVEQNTSFTVKVTAKNSGGNDADTYVAVDRDTLPGGFTVEELTGTRRIWPGRSDVSEVTIGVGEDVVTGGHVVMLFDLTRSDPKSYVNFTVTVESSGPEETRVEEDTGTPASTETETPTETGTAVPGETTAEGDGAMPIPGLGAGVALLVSTLAAARAGHP